MMNDEQKKELFALVAWLETFDTFSFKICETFEETNDPLKVNEQLSKIEVTR